MVTSLPSLVTSPWRERREVWRGNDKCEFLARESANLSPILARQWWRHFRLTTSVSLSLSLSLSLSPIVPHAQYRKRFRASYNKKCEVLLFQRHRNWRPVRVSIVCNWQSTHRVWWHWKTPQSGLGDWTAHFRHRTFEEHTLATEAEGQRLPAGRTSRKEWKKNIEIGMKDWLVDEMKWRLSSIWKNLKGKSEGFAKKRTKWVIADTYHI